MDTLLGIAPAPETSSGVTSTPPPPPVSSPDATGPDSGASKFEAAAQLLEQKRASLAPKPLAAEASADATPAHTEEIPGDGEELSRTPPAAEVSAAEASPESGRGRRRDLADAPPSSRRRSSAPPSPRSSAIPFAIAAAVFVVMFLVGAMRAMRDEFRNVKQSVASQPALVETPPVVQPAAAPEPAPLAAPPAVVAEPDPSPAVPAAPGASAAPPVASSSAEPAATGDTSRVMVRAAVEGAKFFRRGKQIGMNSVIVELAPGEKRTFEVNLPGYVSRKVVVDGSRSEVVVSMSRKRSEGASAAAAEAPAPPQEEASAR